jgi:hypothetical protein
MAKQRALLTDTEREILSGQREVKDNYLYSVQSRVRTRIRGPLKDDIDVLRDNYPELFEEVERAVLGFDEEESSGAARDPPTDDPPASPPADPPTATDTTSGDVGGVTEAHREHLREELAGSGDTLEARVEAIIAMYGHLRKEGEAEKSDFLELVDADVVGYDSPGSVWSNMVKGKDTLGSLPGVEKPDTGLTTWRYRR